MNKDTLSKEIARKTGLKQKDVNLCLGALISTIKNEVAKGESVDITGLMKFSRVIVSGREGVVPGTDTPYKTEAKYNPRVKISDKFKDFVAEVPVAETK